MDAKNCSVCGNDLVDCVCSQGLTQEEKNTPTKGGAVFNTGSGWGASVNRPFHSSTSSGGMFNG
jgi:hypothetical protein